jgi:hypothetical protein
MDDASHHYTSTSQFYWNKALSKEIKGWYKMIMQKRKKIMVVIFFP